MALCRDFFCLKRRILRIRLRNRLLRSSRPDLRRWCLSLRASSWPKRASVLNVASSSIDTWLPCTLMLISAWPRLLRDQHRYSPMSASLYDSSVSIEPCCVRCSTGVHVESFNKRSHFTGHIESIHTKKNKRTFTSVKHELFRECKIGLPDTQSN